MLYYYETKEDYEKAVEEIQKLKELIIDSPALHSPLQVNALTMQVGTILVLSGSYEQAYEHSQQALKGFTNGSLSEITCYNNMFLSSFYLNNFVHALELTENVLDHPQISTDLANFPQWKLYQAYVHYKLGDFSKCNSVLAEIKDLKPDRTGWQFGMLLLEIYKLIAQGLNDAATLKIENQKKMLSTA